ncbi:hypothetical protein L218DRAFT_968649 [Marasmius fiardii PR-910]|nr:hypothetical protein L218DRAFT_968649 [Marasmius fiardii PR-910]
MQDFEDLKEEHEEWEEGRKAAYEADLESWEQEEEIRQRKWVDYIAHAQREVEERKKEEQRRASAVADVSTDTPASAENPDEAESEEPAGIETGYQQRVAEEEEGQKTWKGKAKERSAETKSETEWVPSKKSVSFILFKFFLNSLSSGCVDCVKYDTTCRIPASGRVRACAACKKHKSKCSNTGQPSSALVSADEESLRKTMEEGLNDVVISNETRMDLIEEKMDKIVSLLAENLEVQKRKSSVSASDSAG